MKRSPRFISALCVCLLSAATVAPPAFAEALTLTHELNWGSSGTGNGQFDYPYDVAVDKWGTVYTAGGENTDQRVQRFTSDGTYLGSVPVDRPVAVATDRWGNVYVAQKGYPGKVSVYFKDLYGGTVAGTLQGTAPDALENPTGVSVALDGTVYVAENGQKIIPLTPAGTSYQSWTTDGRCLGATVSQDGEVLVANSFSPTLPYSNFIQVYSPFGTFQRRFGGSGAELGEFDNPWDVAADGGNNTFVSDTGNGRLQAFAAAGNEIHSVGGWGAGVTQLSGPYGVGVGDRAVYVTDQGNNRISKWSVVTPATVANIQGDSRYATAAEASKKAFDASQYAIVATGGNWPDALGGAALAGVLDAPLLLTSSTSLSAPVVAEIQRLGVQKVIVLGGPSAVSDGAYAQLQAEVGPANVTRIWGSNRYQTANAIAERTALELGADYDGTAFVVTGRNFPDALAASPIAAANGWPILLTEPDAVPADVKITMDDIGVTHGYIIGGTGVVSPAVEASLDAEYIEFTRYGEGNRYATAAKVAQVAFDGMGMLWSRPAIATGENFPDALAGGVLQGTDYSPLLLTTSKALSPETAAALAAHEDGIYELRFLGGENAISASARASARALIP